MLRLSDGADKAPSVTIGVPDDVQLQYPFFYKPTFTVMEDGWHAFGLEREFSRMKDLSDEWRLSAVNADYSVTFSCPIDEFSANVVMVSCMTFQCYICVGISI